jgi:hypothetical protein
MITMVKKRPAAWPSEDPKNYFSPGSAAKLHVVTAEEQRSRYRRDANQADQSVRSPVRSVGIA